LTWLFKYYIDYYLMPIDAANRRFKDRLYSQYARVGKALASPHRLELLELLAQCERTVESLADEIHLSMANASQHLQVLRAAGLVDTRREGLFVHYRLADDTVVRLVGVLRTVAERRLADLERLIREQFKGRSNAEPVSLPQLLERARRHDVVVLDTRPAREYLAGHIPGALSVPVDELQQQLRRLPKRTEYVAYCRGPYCVYADRAVEILQASGRRARRLQEGFPEWKAAGFPVETAAARGPLI
jgi:rhodanese-related sulfurtransferase/DNA-binding transcriptional ArsR family regulator